MVSTDSISDSTASGCQEPSRKEGVVRLTPCPPKLAVILELVNLVSAKVSMQDLSAPFSRRFGLGISSEEKNMLDVKAEEIKDTKKADLAILSDYEERIGGVKNAVEAYTLVASFLEPFSERFRRFVWEAEIVHLKTFRDSDADWIFSRNKNERVKALNYRIKKAQTIIERCDLVAGAKEEVGVKLSQLLKKDEELLGDDIFWDVIRSAEDNYTFIREARDKLRRIGNVNPDSLSLRLFPVKTFATLEVDKQGVIRVNQDQFAAAVDGIDSTRIRECKVCERAFWAGRRDSMCCSSNCADKRRKRQHRARYKERLLAEWQKDQEAARDKGKLRPSRSTQNRKQRRST